MLQDGLVDLLKNDAALLGLLAGRIYPVVTPLPQPVYPYMTYQMIRGGWQEASPAYCLDGAQMGSARIQFDAWGQSYADCRIILNALRNTLDCYQGVLVEGTSILGALRNIEIDYHETTARAFRCTCEYIVKYVEP